MRWLLWLVVIVVAARRGCFLLWCLHAWHGCVCGLIQTRADAPRFEAQENARVGIRYKGRFLCGITERVGKQIGNIGRGTKPGAPDTQVLRKRTGPAELVCLYI